MDDGTLNQPQENQWIERAREGDLSAFNQLVLMYQDSAFRMANWMLNDEASAEDIVQTVFLAAYRGIAQFRCLSFRAWLLKMVRNACIDELRRRKRHPWLALEATDSEGEELETARWLIDPGASPEEALLQQERRQTIEQAIWHLSEPMREIILLMDVEGLDYAEAALALGIPLGTVKSRLGRARARLRVLLHEEFAKTGPANCEPGPGCPEEPALMPEFPVFNTQA